MENAHIDKIIESLRPSVKETLEAGERHRIKCYLERREWQLEQFQIGWTKDWSRDELIFRLRDQLRKVRKMKRMGMFGRKRTLAPMLRAALKAETALAQKEAA